MATDLDTDLVEAAIGYRFRTKDPLSLALTAAGADPENHDGNRALALVGAGCFATSHCRQRLQNIMAERQVCLL